jgi:hypothetical protein
VPVYFHVVKNEKKAARQPPLPGWRRIHLLEISWAAAVLVLIILLIKFEHS